MFSTHRLQKFLFCEKHRHTSSIIYSPWKIKYIHTHAPCVRTQSQAHSWAPFLQIISELREKNSQKIRRILCMNAEIYPCENEIVSLLIIHDSPRCFFTGVQAEGLKQINAAIMWPPWLAKDSATKWEAINLFFIKYLVIHTGRFLYPNTLYMGHFLLNISSHLCFSLFPWPLGKPKFYFPVGNCIYI